MSAANKTHGIPQALRSIAVASSVMSAGLAAIYWVSRIGFDNPAGPPLAALGLGLLFINLPVIIWSVFGAREDSSWVTSYPAIWIAVFALVAFIGRVSAGYNPSMLLAPLGTVAFVMVVLPWLRRTSLRFGALLVLGSAFFATWAGGVVWGRIYKSPLFMEMLVGTGIVHHDGVTLAALGNMLRTYHAASMGLDGLGPYMAYHWGTPWLFAQLSNLTGESVLQFYQLGFPVTMIPLFFGSVIATAALIRRREDPTRDWRLWVVFVAATIGIFPITGMDALGVWTSNLLISESYTVAIPSALMLVALTVHFWRTRGDSVRGGSASLSDHSFAFVVLPAGLVALGYIKISIMILGFGAAAYAFLRLGLWRKWPLVLAALWTTLLVFLAYKRVSLVAHHEGIVPLDYLKSFVPRVWWPFFFLAQLFWSTLYVVLRLRKERARTLGDLIALASSGRILDVEVVAAVAVAGVLPGLILHIDGGSAFYFSDVQRWLSVSLFLAAIPLLLPSVDRFNFRRLSTWGVAFIAIPLGISTARNSVYWTSRMLRANAELRRELYPAAERASILPRSRSLPQLASHAKLEAGLDAAENFNPVAGLLELAKMPLEEKRQTAVFVPQSETRYWTILKRPNACGFGGFLVPSLTGIAMIDGMPAADCRLSPYYGLSLFTHRTAAQTAADASPDAVCRKAAAKGFTQVMVLHFDENGVMSSTKLECGA